jgi:hypothetical protein
MHTADDTPENPKSFFLKTRNPQKGTCRGPQGRRRHPSKCQKLFSENKKPPKRDMPRPARPPKTPLKMPKAFFRKQETPKKGHAAADDTPQNPKSFFPKTRNPEKGTCARRLRPICAHFAIMVTIFQNDFSFLRDHVCSRKNGAKKVPQFT